MSIVSFISSLDFGRRLFMFAFGLSSYEASWFIFGFVVCFSSPLPWLCFWGTGALCMNLGSHFYTPGGEAPIEILLEVFLLPKDECRWRIYSAAGQPILSRTMFLIRETPFLSNLFLLLVCFFLVVAMLVAVVPRCSVGRERGRMVLLGGALRDLHQKGFPLSVFWVCLLKQRIWLHHFKTSGIARISWLAWLQRAARSLGPHLWLALALCSCPAHEGHGSVLGCVWLLSRVPALRSRQRKHWGPFDPTMFLTSTGINLTFALLYNPLAVITESRLDGDDFAPLWGSRQESEAKRHQGTSPKGQEFKFISLITMSSTPLSWWSGSLNRQFCIC